MGFADKEIFGEGFIERFDRRYPTSILETLLCDRTTGRNIIWADNEYEALGDGYMGDDEITVEKITGMNSGVIKPRIAKEQESQSLRTKSRAEVFTPSWLCNQMNNDTDEAWFGRRDVFNTESAAEDGTKMWVTTTEPIVFPKQKGCGWHAYVEAPRLEITCGEAPFVCSRYDTVTGYELPVRERVGFLDRKLRVVSEKTKTRKEWVRRALDALRATYGFEYQGDNLLIARINVLETFAEHFHDRWGTSATQEELEQAAWIVSWNFWQMNGFTDAVPTNKMDVGVESTLGTFEEPKPVPVQPSLFELFDDAFSNDSAWEGIGEESKDAVPLCVIYDWKNGEPFEFASLKGKASVMGKKFYAVIGNPPYQEETESDSTRKQPIYNYFMDQAYLVGNHVELITPARFLFDGGYTPKQWNRKMLDDPHLKVVFYENDSTKVFPGILLEGGVAVTYRDATTSHQPIGIFVKYEELNRILSKVLAKDFQPLSDLITPPLTYQPTDLFAKNYPQLPNRFRSNSFDCQADVFHAELPKDGKDYIGMEGLAAGSRARRYILREYVEDKSNKLSTWKVLIPESNGASGKLCDEPARIISKPFIAPPDVGYMQTYIAVCGLQSEFAAKACLKYVQSKFSRVLLGILKVTQHNPGSKWIYVPLQDFTSGSDIDWSQSVADIDRQLYAKYGLDDEEITFIESHVKEMD